MTAPALLACECAISPRSRNTYREVVRSGRRVMICGWCRSVAHKAAKGKAKATAKGGKRK